MSDFSFVGLQAGPTPRAAQTLLILHLDVSPRIQRIRQRLHLARGCTSMTITDTLALALQHHERGELALAEQGAQAVLGRIPNHAGAFHLLGLIARNRNNLEQPVLCLNRSLLSDKSNALTECQLV